MLNLSTYLWLSYNCVPQDRLTCGPFCDLPYLRATCICLKLNHGAFRSKALLCFPVAAAKPRVPVCSAKLRHKIKQAVPTASKVECLPFPGSTNLLGLRLIVRGTEPVSLPLVSPSPKHPACLPPTNPRSYTLPSQAVF